jgi:hypothetical protein
MRYPGSFDILDDILFSDLFVLFNALTAAVTCLTGVLAQSRALPLIIEALLMTVPTVSMTATAAFVAAVALPSTRFLNSTIPPTPSP